MDTSSIQAGAEWPSGIKSALDFARAVLVILGHEWVRVSDEWGERRIDQDEDWVRKEIEQALAQNKEVIPVLVNGARMPPADKLPPSISTLPNRQAIEIRTAYWDHDMKLLLSRLEALSETPLAQKSVGPYPVPPRRDQIPLVMKALRLRSRELYRSGGRSLVPYRKRQMLSERNCPASTRSRPSGMRFAL
jgi:TIR domain